MDSKEIIGRFKLFRFISWVLLIFLPFMIIVSLPHRDWLEVLVYALVIIGIALLLPRIQRIIDGKTTPYRPGKGFWYQRLPAKDKRIYLTFTLWALLILLLVLYFTDTLNRSASAACVGGIIASVVLKRRIKFHTEIDAATLQKLEYLIIIVMASSEIGDRYEIQLKDIMGFDLLNAGKYGVSSMFRFSLVDGMTLGVMLEGKSKQGSPEQFIHSMLKALDKLYLEPGTN